MIDIDYRFDSKDRRKYNFLLKTIPHEWFVRLSSDFTHDVVLTD